MKELRGLELGYQTFEFDAGEEVAIVGCRLKACDLGGAKIVGIYGSTLDECLLVGCDLTECVVQASKLYTCVLPKSGSVARVVGSSVCGCRVSEAVMKVLQGSESTSVANVTHQEGFRFIEGLPKEAVAWS